MKRILITGQALRKFFKQTKGIGPFYTPDYFVMGHGTFTQFWLREKRRKPPYVPEGALLEILGDGKMYLNGREYLA